MRHRLVTTLAFFLSGCGAEVVSTEAVSGMAKAQEAKLGQQNLEGVQKKPAGAKQTAQERSAEAEKPIGY